VGLACLSAEAITHWVKMEVVVGVEKAPVQALLRARETKPDDDERAAATARAASR